METEKELKIRGYLSQKGFKQEQIELVIALVDQACIKLLEDVIAALNKKKSKIKDE